MAAVILIYLLIKSSVILGLNNPDNLLSNFFNVHLRIGGISLFILPEEGFIIRMAFIF